jgi:hypothetical protein
LSIYSTTQGAEYEGLVVPQIEYEVQEKEQDLIE